MRSGLNRLHHNYIRVHFSDMFAKSCSFFIYCNFFEIHVEWCQTNAYFTIIKIFKMKKKNRPKFWSRYSVENRKILPGAVYKNKTKAIIILKKI